MAAPPCTAVPAIQCRQTPPCQHPITPFASLMSNMSLDSFKTTQDYTYSEYRVPEVKYRTYCLGVLSEVVTNFRLKAFSIRYILDLMDTIRV